MPRRRKTVSGAPAQEIKSVPGQRYGEGAQQAQMQRAMPAPNRVAAAPEQRPVSMANAAPTVAQQPAVPAAPVDPVEALRAIPTGLLQQPDQRPVTSGLNFGPGRPMSSIAGPRPTRPVSRTLEMMYDMTNNPVFARLLERFNP